MSLVYARRGGSDTGGTDAVLDSTEELAYWESKFESEYGSLTSLESDLCCSLRQYIQLTGV